MVRDKKEWQSRRQKQSEQRQGHGKAQNMSTGGTGPYGAPTCNGWRETKLRLGTGTKSVRALKARLKNLAFTS